MTKLIPSIRAHCPIPVVFFLAMLTGFLPPAVFAMDSRLVLATEEITREMRRSGELPPVTGDREVISRSGNPTPDGDVSQEEEGSGPILPVSESEELIVETSVVSLDEPADPAPEPEEIALEEILRRRVSLKYVDADIRVVLRSLARAYDFNVTLAPEVEGNVTLDFTNVRIIDALETILVDQGLGYRITGDIIRVTTQEKLREETAASAAQEVSSAQKAAAEAEKRVAAEAAEPLVVEIFNLKYIDAGDAREAIEPLLTVGRGTAAVLQTKQFRGFQFEHVEAFAAEDREAAEFVRSRVLIVQDTQSVVNRIESVIERIDHKPPQILIDAKILEVPVDHEFRLGIDWTQALNGWNVGFRDLQATFDKHYGSVHERVTEESRRRGVDRLDQQLTFDDPTRTDERGSTAFSTRRSERLSEQRSESGLPYQLDESLSYRVSDSLSSNVHNVLRERGYSESQSQQIFDNYLHNVASNLSRMATAGQTYSAVLNAADFNLMLSAMQTDSNVVILSNPRIIVHENYAAQIFVGRRYPILSTEFESGAGRDAVGGTSVDEWREIGITLKVIPQVRSLLSGEDGINMIVHPAVSDIDGFAFAYSPTGEIFQSSYPIISIREADTNVTIRDGDTIVIGGLISSRTMDRVSKIPLLGDIPILGYLFKEEHTRVEKINLLIFITARIVTEDTEFSAYEKMMLEKMPPEALQDVRYFDDTLVRPHRYLPPEVPEPAAVEETPEPEGKNADETDELSGNRGNLPGRVTTRAMERSRR